MAKPGRKGKGHWKETRKESADLNQKGGPFSDKRRKHQEEAADDDARDDLEEWEEDVTDDVPDLEDIE